MDSLPPLPQLPPNQRTALLDTLFEPCPPLHTLSLPLLSTPTLSFPTYSDLIRAIRSQLFSLLKSSKPSDVEWLDSILRAHPRLGAKKVESKLSRGEQGAMGGGGAGVTEEERREKEEESEKLRVLNEEYENKFPGLIYMVFVNGRSRPVIMEDMRRRIDRGDIDAERAEAIEALCLVANDRAKKLQE
ncbi:hypothetical protein K402DRAFT_242963 [Aulographum hederae CBS 113979]|uniref:Oxo-4-hydroxy-4-carboxy-5-ureidoimidazoline decarboxylase domain-containing protein n=1 Tax=Aulographum hederae CBS 113979 TaxID=1176131 RepID=A0A6G1HA21_9PEZI|nr:hypothetical protein K402DRAFT_242963 [Aulographum hederae CBS 113979]